MDSLRPPLSEKSFPVSRVGKKTDSRLVGSLLFFPLISFFINKNVQREKVKKIWGGEGILKKEFQSALFSPLGWWTGNNFLFKGGLMGIPLSRLMYITTVCYNVMLSWVKSISQYLTMNSLKKIIVDIS